MNATVELHTNSLFALEARRKYPSVCPGQAGENFSRR